MAGPGNELGRTVVRPKESCFAALRRRSRKCRANPAAAVHPLGGRTTPADPVAACREIGSDAPFRRRGRS